MQVLELKPLKNKKLKIVVIESEFPIEWRLEKPSYDKDILGNLVFISRSFIQFINKIVEQYKPDFVVEDKGMRSFGDEHKGDEFAEIFNKKGIIYKLVDIPEYALNHLSVPLQNRKELIKKFDQEIKKYKEMGRIHHNDYHFQQLVMWRQHLNDEYKMEEDELRYQIREAWMMMGLLELAKKQEKRHLIALFICDKSHFDGISFLAKELDIQCEFINIQKKTKNFDDTASISKIVRNSVLEIMPITVKKKEREEKILYIFDTDEYCSPFDTNMGYDAGFDVVLPYCKMTAERIPKLVEDAMFSRKVGAPTVYFVGGSNIEEGEKIAEAILDTLVPPFESPVIIDPRGAHTTAPAIVVKTLEVVRNHGISDLYDKKIVILGGTGPVGQICAIIASRLHSNVTITSRRENFVKNLATELTKKAGKSATTIKGVVANIYDEKFEILNKADIIWSVGKAGIQMISRAMLNRLSPNKICVDINLVPPYGIEGLEPKFTDKEFLHGIFGIGALDIGQLKYKIENLIFKKAATSSGKKIFDYNYAFKLATKLIFGSEIEITN